jgi:hypothetical protein
MRDDVLRCCVAINRGGKGEVRIVDTVEDGDSYLLVFEWMTFPGKEDQGEHPKRTIRIKKDQFQVSQDLKSGFELVLKTPLDFDKIQFIDVDTTEEEIRSNPDNLFAPRPNDDDPAR